MAAASRFTSARRLLLLAAGCELFDGQWRARKQKP
jgi:hypothetical protein